MPAQAAVPTGPVTRHGNTLERDGRPWRFVGFDDYQAMSDPDGGGFVCGAPTSDSGLEAAMHQIRAAGGDVIRTWWFASYHDPGAADPWGAFDRLLADAAADGVEVVPVLANEYPDCDDHHAPLTLSDYRPGSPWWTADRAWVTEVATRYAGDPTIAWWELVNEPAAPDATGSCDEPAAAGALAAYAGAMAAVVHAVDPGHLVDMGTIGTGQCGTAGADYARVSGAPGIGVCEYHDYGDPALAMPDDGYNRLAQRLAQCRALDEPLVVGEAGIDAGSPCSPTTLEARAAEFRAKLDAAFAGGAAGYLPWQLATTPSCATPPDDAGHTYGIGPGDPTDTVLAAQAAALAPGPRRRAAASHGAPTAGPARSGGDGATGAIVAVAAVGGVLVAALTACAVRRRRVRSRRRDTAPR